ncbi:MAG: SRPBCC domain-containing protein [Bacteroidota bacterium]
MEFTFDQFIKKIHIKASVEKLYSHWSTSEGISKWFLSGANYTSSDGIHRNPKEEIQTGDRYLWKWHNWNGKESGTILRANGVDFIEFTFGNDACKVSVHLQKAKETTLLTLKQYDMATDEETKMNLYNGCSCGWTFWLANLKAYLEHGILLNERHVDLTNIPQAGHIFVNM